jgi:hypothetical protein
MRDLTEQARRTLALHDAGAIAPWNARQWRGIWSPTQASNRQISSTVISAADHSPSGRAPAEPQRRAGLLLVAALAPFLTGLALALLSFEGAPVSDPLA